MCKKLLLGLTCLALVFSIVSFWTGNFTLSIALLLVAVICLFGYRNCCNSCSLDCDNCPLKSLERKWFIEIEEATPVKKTVAKKKAPAKKPVKRNAVKKKTKKTTETTETKKNYPKSTTKAVEIGKVWSK